MYKVSVFKITICLSVGRFHLLRLRVSDALIQGLKAVAFRMMASWGFENVFKIDGRKFTKQKCPSVVKIHMHRETDHSDSGESCCKQKRLGVW